MLIYNLSKTIRNIWLQQFENRGTCLFVTTSNNYVQTFKESSLYYFFYKEVHLELLRTKMNCTCVGLINLGTKLKLLLQLPNTLQALVFMLENHIWKVKKCLRQLNAR